MNIVRSIGTGVGKNFRYVQTYLKMVSEAEGGESVFFENEEDFQANAAETNVLLAKKGMRLFAKAVSDCQPTKRGTLRTFVVSPRTPTALK